MRLRLLAFVVLAALACAVAVVTASGASFTSASDTTLQAGTESVTSWLHLYSQSSDPDGQTGYATRSGTSNPAATGTDATLTVNLGGKGTSGSNQTVSRVFSLRTVSPFPNGGSTITITASLQADPTTGFQPINAIGFDSWGSTGRTNPLTASRNTKYQCNLRINMSGSTAGKQYIPRILVTVTYTGMTTTYYQYTVPVAVYAGSGAGPNTAASAQAGTIVGSAAKLTSPDSLSPTASASPVPSGEPALTPAPSPTASPTATATPTSTPSTEPSATPASSAAPTPSPTPEVAITVAAP